jgi:hypothetical protein
MIPQFNKSGYLPPGKPYLATWHEISIRFGTTKHRKKLLGGLYKALKALKKAGCRIVYINGSFVTDKAEPNDWDGCWEIEGVNFAILDPLIVDEDFKHSERKREYLGDLFLQAPRLPGRNFVTYFQKDRDGKRKGIIKINLENLP